MKLSVTAVNSYADRGPVFFPCLLQPVRDEIRAHGISRIMVDQSQSFIRHPPKAAKRCPSILSDHSQRAKPARNLHATVTEYGAYYH